jgi:hypothetical protein
MVAGCAGSCTPPTTVGSVRTGLSERSSKRRHERPQLANIALQFRTTENFQMLQQDMSESFRFEMPRGVQAKLWR